MADVALLVGGLVLLMLAADRMVTAAANLAGYWGMSPVVAGAVILGFGSSMPELLVSVLALDQPNGLDLAMGNVIGSNIANIGLVLGVSVLLFPAEGQSGVVRREGVLMLAGLLAMTWFLWDGALGRGEGWILMSGMVASAFLVIRWSRTLTEEAETPTGRPSISPLREAFVAIVGLMALVAGARAMVLGAEGLAIEFGLAEGLVGLTILALGTSLPELGATIAALRQGRTDLGVGNILGSNLFNALGVAGLAGVLGGGTTTIDFRPELGIMVLVALLAGLAALSGDRLRRFEGALLIVAYPLAVLVAL